jgi:excinuclease ABC subunit C
VPDAETHRHCHNDVIRFCSAPCIGKISQAEYLERVAEACAFLRGERSGYLGEVRAAMEAAAAALDFERAAALRDTLADVHQTIRERAKVVKSAARKSSEAGAGLAAIQGALELSSRPALIEMFDISNISGTLAVAGMVAGVEGRPDRKRYRRFRIRSVEGPNDFAMMAEVIRRRYGRLKEEGGGLPDLVLVDGGLGQVHAARAELDALGLEQVRVGGLAKRFEELFSDRTNKPVCFEKDSPALIVLQQLRDEAHRFAIAYHRELRSKRIRESELDEIPGIGERRKRQLLQHFGSVARLKRARVEDIASIPGFGGEMARLLHQCLSRSKPAIQPEQDQGM